MRLLYVQAAEERGPKRGGAAESIVLEELNYSVDIPDKKVMTNRTLSGGSLGTLAA